MCVSDDPKQRLDVGRHFIRGGRTRNRHYDVITFRIQLVSGCGMATDYHSRDAAGNDSSGDRAWSAEKQ